MPAPLTIEIGQKFGRWTTIGPPCSRGGRRYVPCRCVCGTQRAVALHSLRRGTSTRCGYECAVTATVIDGDRFGRWTVVATWLEPLPGRQRVRRARVRCDCGKERVADARMLQTGASLRCKSCSATERQTIHGASATPTYASWQGMNHRCHNPRDAWWDYYGGRGITVCDQWRAELYGGTSGAFERFLADMGERPEGRTIDRIDNDGGYEPGNCRWATASEQRRSRRAP